MNTFGSRFKLTTYGESHGPAIGGVVDGCPAGLLFDSDLVVAEMSRRHIGPGATSRVEADQVEILSGIYQGRTLGTPIAFEIRNNDARSEDYDELRDLMRPGHADYTYYMRYGIRDHRGGGRASARETAARVVGGAIAKMILNDKNITVEATLAGTPTSPLADNQTFKHSNIQALKHSSTQSDSQGGVIECTVNGLPAGIGNPVFDKLNARLAAAMMSIPSAIGFEMGIGFAAANMTGSDFRDEWAHGNSVRPVRRTITNHCGGIQGGISNGMPIVFRTAFHPVVTINQPTECLDANGNLHTWQPRGRHDQCHLPRTVVIVEAMTAMTIADMIC
ncbi:MAG: chorismate synthase [Bacteroidales bacterium]|nr:chorismate synthase [Bacteroidales bacterium]